MHIVQRQTVREVFSNILFDYFTDVNQVAQSGQQQHIDKGIVLLAGRFKAAFSFAQKILALIISCSIQAAVKRGLHITHQTLYIINLRVF